MDNSENGRFVELTADLVSAFVSNNSVRAEELPQLIADVFGALSRGAASNKSPMEEVAEKPAVPVRSSVKPDHIVCLEDGKKFKSLKRHLRTDHSLSPDEYRRKWDLPSNYPMVAPEYGRIRSELARSIGLGRKRELEAEPARKQPASRGRSRKAAD